jgi:hypothetical protein
VSSNLRIFDVSRRHGVATQQRQYAILAYRNELLHCPRMSPDAPAHVTALTHGRRIGPWTCPGCRESRDTVFCGVCGEKRLDHHDLTIAGLAEHAIESLTHLDGRVFRNLRDLVVRPGTLTAAYINGHRKPYFAPFQIFLITNLLFFVLQSALGFQVLSNDLGSHIGTAGRASQHYSAIARPIAERRLATTNRTIEGYTHVFNHAVRVNAKAMVVLMVPAIVLISLASFPRARFPLITSVVFALHFLAFFLLLEAFLMPLVGIPAGILLGVLSLGWLWDPLISAILIALCAVWIYKAYRRVYGAPPISAAFRSVALSLLFIPIVIGYRFVVFLVTLYTT